MNLSKKVKRFRRQKIAICQEPGCEKEYVGDYMRKFCNFHSDPKMRKRTPRHDRPGQYDGSQILVNREKIEVEMKIPCGLEGCDNTFTRLVKPFHKKPGHPSNVYPKFCKEHRNAYKRFVFKWMRRVA